MNLHLAEGSIVITGSDGCTYDVGVLRGATVTRHCDEELTHLADGQPPVRLPKCGWVSFEMPAAHLDPNCLGRILGQVPEGPVSCSVEMTIEEARYRPDNKPRRRPAWIQRIPGPSRFRRRVVRAWRKALPLLPPVLVKGPTKLVFPNASVHLEESRFAGNWRDGYAEFTEPKLHGEAVEAIFTVGVEV